MPVYLRKSLQNTSLPMNLLPHSRVRITGQTVTAACEPNTPHRLEPEGENSPVCSRGLNPEALLEGGGV